MPYPFRWPCWRFRARRRGGPIGLGAALPSVAKMLAAAGCQCERLVLGAGAPMAGFVAPKLARIRVGVVGDTGPQQTLGPSKEG